MIKWVIRKMIDKSLKKNTTIILVILFAAYAVINIESPLKNDDSKELSFPGILGDSLLKNSQTGKDTIINITLYDNFTGDVVQGYKAAYSNPGNNKTMVVFIAQMKDNITANNSLKSMVIMDGYDRAYSNESNDNITIVKLPVQNPEVFAIRKNKNTMWHYTFYKSDKVYWVGFNNTDMQYQVDMLEEVYRNVDKTKDDSNI
jgi:hypothetical protein